MSLGIRSRLSEAVLAWEAKSARRGLHSQSCGRASKKGVGKYSSASLPESPSCNQTKLFTQWRLQLRRESQGRFSGIHQPSSWPSTSGKPPRLRRKQNGKSLQGGLQGQGGGDGKVLMWWVRHQRSLSLSPTHQDTEEATPLLGRIGLVI